MTCQHSLSTALLTRGIQFSHSEEVAVISLLYCSRKKHREVKTHTQSHTTRRWWGHGAITHTRTSNPQFIGTNGGPDLICQESWKDFPRR